MLFGEFRHNVDKKGRIFIPAKLREGLGERFVVCMGFDGNHCLFVYSAEEWQKLDEKIQAMPTMKSRKIRRFIYSSAVELECDAQGRVLIPQKLREYAQLNGAAAIVGVSNHVEIWSGDQWEEENAENTPENIAALMEELDF